MKRPLVNGIKGFNFENNNVSTNRSHLKYGGVFWNLTFSVQIHFVQTCFNILRYLVYSTNKSRVNRDNYVHIRLKTIPLTQKEYYITFMDITDSGTEENLITQHWNPRLRRAGITPQYFTERSRNTYRQNNSCRATYFIGIHVKIVHTRWRVTGTSDVSVSRDRSK